ncbi:RNA-directed DNA polymerase, eukaryota [Tanacetum coccineum]
MDRLIGNLCTLWVGRFHLHANAVQYERPLKPPSSGVAPVRKYASYSFKQSGSYAAAVNDNHYPSVNVPVSCPSDLVLDDSCVNSVDLSRHVMGRVKELSSIPNLPSILTKEGFAEVQFSYLGGLWVLMDLNNENTQKKLLQHTGVNSWFHELQAATHDFVSNERVVWVDIEGIPMKFWSPATFAKIGKKWGETMDMEEASSSSFARKRICVKTSKAHNILESFKIIFRGNTFMVRAKELFTWTPCFFKYKESGYISDNESIHGTNNNSNDPLQGEAAVEGENDDDEVSVNLDNSNHFCNIRHNDSVQEDAQHSDDPFGCYDLLKNHPAKDGLDLDPFLSHPPGFTPRGGNSGRVRVGRLAGQKTPTRT